MKSAECVTLHQSIGKVRKWMALQRTTPKSLLSYEQRLEFREALSLSSFYTFLEPDHLAIGFFSVDEGPCHSRCPMRLQLPFDCQRTDTCLHQVSKVSSYGLKVQVFPLALQHGMTHCRLGVAFPAMSFEP